jgi:hypothetical protein
MPSSANLRSVRVKAATAAFQFHQKGISVTAPALLQVEHHREPRRRSPLSIPIVLRSQPQEEADKRNENHDPSYNHQQH